MTLEAVDSREESGNRRKATPLVAAVEHPVSSLQIGLHPAGRIGHQLDEGVVHLEQRQRYGATDLLQARPAELPATACVVELAAHGIKNGEHDFGDDGRHEIVNGAVEGGLAASDRIFDAARSGDGGTRKICRDGRPLAPRVGTIRMLECLLEDELHIGEMAASPVHIRHVEERSGETGFIAETLEYSGCLIRHVLGLVGAGGWVHDAVQVRKLD